jgi:hypothetical protein
MLELVGVMVPFWSPVYSSSPTNMLWTPGEVEIHPVSVNAAQVRYIIISIRALLTVDNQNWNSEYVDSFADSKLLWWRD